MEEPKRKVNILAKIEDKIPSIFIKKEEDIGEKEQTYLGIVGKGVGEKGDILE